MVQDAQDGPSGAPRKKVKKKKPSNASLSTVSAQKKVNNKKRQKRHREELLKKNITRVEFKITDQTKKQIKDLSKRYNLDRNELLQKLVESTVWGDYDHVFKSDQGKTESPES